jgi:hypothetical protein
LICVVLGKTTTFAASNNLLTDRIPDLRPTRSNGQQCHDKPVTPPNSAADWYEETMAHAPVFRSLKNATVSRFIPTTANLCFSTPKRITNDDDLPFVRLKIKLT